MSLRGLDEWITGNWGDDYWRSEQVPEADYARCAPCRDEAHNLCRGRSYRPKFPPIGQGCDCDCQHERRP